MNNFKKTVLGALFAAILLLVSPAQEAQAAGVTLTPPDKQFFFTKTPVEWVYQAPLGGTQLLSSNTLGVNESVSYFQFNTSGTIFDDPSKEASGNLSMFLNAVGIIKDGSPSNDHFGTLSIYRVSDFDVFHAASNVPNIGQFAPIALGEHLATNTYKALVNESISFDFVEKINSTIVGGDPYVSFAVVAGVLDATTNSTIELAGSQSLFITPAPEPMSLSYMLLGCLAFAFRRIKKMALGMFGLA